jgi:hypothetical protein
MIQPAGSLWGSNLAAASGRAVNARLEPGRGALCIGCADAQAQGGNGGKDHGFHVHVWISRYGPQCAAERLSCFASAWVKTRLRRRLFPAVCEDCEPDPRLRSGTGPQISGWSQPSVYRPSDQQIWQDKLLINRSEDRQITYSDETERSLEGQRVDT